MSRHPIWFLILLLLFTTAVLVSWRGEVSAEITDQKDNWSSLTTGREVYEAACAACHGTRGTGTDRTFRGFDISPPDFTDCAFSSREPAIDWYGIAHSGGPTQEFDQLMPAFGDVLTKEQIEAAVAHIKRARDDSTFEAGKDQITFRIPVAGASGPFTVTTALWYQPIGYRWAMNLASVKGREPQRFMKMYHAMPGRETAVRLTHSTAVIEPTTEEESDETTPPRDCVGYFAEPLSRPLIFRM